MAKVSYTIEVTLARRKTDQFLGERIEKERSVHIRSCGEEQTPLLIELNDPYYRLTEEKTVRQRLFDEIGELRMETHQPCYIYAGSRNVKYVPKHRFMTVTLRFQPSKAPFQLPKLEKLNIKLNATTFYSAKPLEHISSVEPVPYDLSARQFSKRLFLAAHSPQHLQWVEHDSKDRSPTTSSSPQNSLEESKQFALLIMHQRWLSLFSHRLFLYC